MDKLIYRKKKSKKKISLKMYRTFKAGKIIETTKIFFEGTT